MKSFAAHGCSQIVNLGIEFRPRLEMISHWKKQRQVRVPGADEGGLLHRLERVAAKIFGHDLKHHQWGVNDLAGAVVREESDGDALAIEVRIQAQPFDADIVSGAQLNFPGD